MSDNIEKKETPLPQAMTELEWVWVLAKPLSQERDSIFVLDLEEAEEGGRRRVVPAFETREDAAQLKGKLCGDAAAKHSEQSIRLSELGRFAAKNKLEIMLLDAQGTIMAHLEARIESVAVH